MSRCADAGRVQDLLHRLLVPEPGGLLDAHAGQPEVLADACRQHDVGLPQAFDLVDPNVASKTFEGGENGGLIGERDVLVVRKVLLRLLRECVDWLVTDPDDLGTGLGDCPREVGLLQREARRDHDDVHGIPPLLS